MASEPFIDYKPTWEVLGGGDVSLESGSDSATERNRLKSAEEKGKDPSKEKGGRDKYRTHDELKIRSVLVVNVSSALDGCDDQLLPATFRALESDLGFHPSLLGYITLSQTLCLSIFCPLWGYLADRHSRKWLLVFGTTAWGIITTALGLVSEFWQVALLRALNGVFLGSVGPVSQSILADTSRRRSLGYSFGLVQLCTSMGRLVGGVVTTTVAQVQMGALKGWRACFICVGALSCLLGVLISFILEEIPRRRVLRPRMDDSGGTGSVSQSPDTWSSFLKAVFTESVFTPSVLIVILEGLVGTIPWSAFSFNTMFFQYCNMSDLKAAYIMGALLIGSAVGGVLGGLLGDKLYEWSPWHGRPLVGQFAMAVRVPLLVIAYVVVPKEETSFTIFMFLALFVGLSSMAGVAVNRPILADVVRPNHKATVFALTVAVEGSGAAILGAPLVGYLAEHSFGYLRTTLLVSEMPEQLRVGNANALAAALAFLTVIPWSISFILYGLLHFTYGRDQERMNTIVEKEYRQDEQDEQDGQDRRHTRMGDVDTETAVSADAVAEGFVGGDDSNSDATPLRSSPRRAEALSRSSTDVQRQPQQ
ncbi:transmembrane domian-containing protein, putative [Eimeria necatrix]|uniref:Transmembrane domian-containing protein, putative n=1 Tax=Eimeria necatrix TaxID=51315 RepID=U6MRG1_9EIME|nr:transmembrane domian-containing protein, putative [Eimeria necatrix]CDJ65678.1 transmembrane domian-containing protein, putative [Eimeria necatrix]